MRRGILLILLGLLMTLSCIGDVNAFSWGGNEGRSTLPQSLEEHIVNPSLSIHDRSRLPNVYAVAMQELQELESEPLCHRIAARLLVNNCQLLDGKDDATVLTDSGRQVRDFVDSYAASLAICDLERGSFTIPSTCAPFRERSLASIPDSSIPRLHASPQQIDSCLSGLAKSDSAWNTWVSYRHKALRFCEAARADNEKGAHASFPDIETDVHHVLAQSIRLHQRLTEVLSKLSEGVEQELESHLRAINIRATETTDQLRRMIPDIEQLRNSLQALDRTISEDVIQISRASNSMMRDGLEDAQSLHQLLGILLKTVMSNNAEVTASQEMALASLRERTNSEVAVVMSTLATAAASSASLQSLMELSHVRVVELASRQEDLEKGLVRLLDITEDLSSRYESHTEKLDLAQQISGGILETLDDMVISTSEVRNSLGHGASWTSWMPYIICPAASLLMGSYGLPPSATRNIGLILLGELFSAIRFIVLHAHLSATGEITGFVISSAQNFTLSVLNISRPGLPPFIDKNTTFAFGPAKADILHSLPLNLRTASPNLISDETLLVSPNIRLPSSCVINSETRRRTAAMADRFKIALIQMHPKVVAPEENFAKAELYIRSAASQGCSLAVLPEYHLTSWVPDHPQFVPSCAQSGVYLEKYRALARDLGISIVPGTIIELDGEEGDDDLDLLNVAYFIGPDGGVLGQYTKKNLWHNERPHLTKGPEPHGAFDTPLGRAGMLVCWDLAFPEAFRELIRDGARIIVCPAFWLADEYKRKGGEGGAQVVNRDSERVFLENVMVARAFENTAAVVLVNAGGPVGGGGVEVREGGTRVRYCGVSQVAMPLIGPQGKLGAEEAMEVVEVDLGLLDVAEGAYKVREDMKNEGWHYGYSIVKE
ncbi:putative nuclear membrane fusion protein Kar5 [Colletotrichum sublineola]|uniref:Putative nuclear membrane fusion protein Kar5 n=1 Tax=Colletotrichum sublineola TaxID=1173701 RepID=A0A066XS04_COLSU|nr:putative nuclear membrane fusion protein Kar5 [Colletotrichum sublineola]